MVVSHLLKPLWSFLVTIHRTEYFLLRKGLPGFCPSTVEGMLSEYNVRLAGDLVAGDVPTCQSS